MSDKDILSKYLGARSKNSSNLLGTYISIIPQVSQKDRELAPISAGLHDVFSTLLKAKLYKKFEEQRELAERLEAQEKAEKKAEKADKKARDIANTEFNQKMQIKKYNLAREKYENKKARNKNSGIQHAAAIAAIESKDSSEWEKEANKFEVFFPGITEEVKKHNVKNVKPDQVVAWASNPGTPLKEEPLSLMDKLIRKTRVGRIISGKKAPQYVIDKKSQSIDEEKEPKERNAALKSEKATIDPTKPSKEKDLMISKETEKIMPLRAAGDALKRMIGVERLERDSAAIAQDPLGALSTLGSAALFDTPEMIKPLKKKIQEFKKEHPEAYNDLGKVGFIASLPVGSAGVKVVGKGAKIVAPQVFKSLATEAAKASPKARALQSAIEGSVIGSAYGVGQQAKEQDNNEFLDYLGSAGKGAVAGAAFGGITTAALNTLKRLGAGRKLFGKQFGVKAPSSGERETAKALGDTAKEVEAVHKLVPEEKRHLYDVVTQADEKALRHLRQEYQRTPQAREKIWDRERNWKKEQGDELMRVLGILGDNPQPIDKLLENRRILRNKAARPFYEKFDPGIYEVPKDLEKTQMFVRAQKKAMDSYNPDKFNKNSGTILNKTKTILDDLVENAKKNTEHADVLTYTEMVKNFREALAKQNPDYAKALNIESSLYKIEDAIKKGSEAFNKNVKVTDIDKYLRTLSVREKEGFKDGFLSTLIDKVHDRATGSIMPEAGSWFENEENKRKILRVWGKQGERILERLRPINKSIESLRRQLSGSKTAEHGSDITGGDAANSGFAPIRFIKKWTGKAIDYPLSVIKKGERLRMIGTWDKPKAIQELVRNIAKYDKYSKLGRLSYSAIPGLTTRLMMRKPSDD
jgi:hypothetical protein